MYAAGDASDSASGVGVGVVSGLVSASSGRGPGKSKGTPMKSLFIVALIALPGAALANSHMEKKTATTVATAPASGLPKCTAKVQDSCDQSMTTEKNALDHYPAETRDADNNKMGKAAMAPAAKPAMKHKAAMKHSAMKADAMAPDAMAPAK